MNCPSPVHCPEGDGMNQNPNALAPALTTRQDLNGIANARVLRRLNSIEHVTEDDPGDDAKSRKEKPAVVGTSEGEEAHVNEPFNREGGPPGGFKGFRVLREYPGRVRDVVKTFAKFVGPGFMASLFPLPPLQGSKS
jgi:metal iron transporter